MSVSPDGRTLAISTGEQALLYRFNENWSQVEPLGTVDRLREPSRLAVTDGGERLFAAGSSLSVFDGQTGKRLIQMAQCRNPDGDRPIRVSHPGACLISADGGLAAVFGHITNYPANELKQSVAWQLDSEPADFSAGTEIGDWKAFSATCGPGSTFATLLGESGWVVLEWKDRQWHERFRGPWRYGDRQAVYVPAPDGIESPGKIAFATADGRVVLRPVESSGGFSLLQSVHTLDSLLEAGRDSANRSTTPGVYELDAYGERYSWTSYGDPSFHLAASPDGRWIAGCRHRDIYLWSADWLNLQCILRATETENAEIPKLAVGGWRSAGALFFSPDGAKLIHTAADGELRIWKTAAFHE